MSHEQTGHKENDKNNPNCDKFIGLTGLTAFVRSDSTAILRETMGDTEARSLEVPVAEIKFDNSGNVVAVGVRRREQLRHVVDSGDPNANFVGFLEGPYSDVVDYFTPDGRESWPPARVLSVEEVAELEAKRYRGDPYDAPYI